MSRIYTPHKPTVDAYGNVIIQSKDIQALNYIVGKNLNDIIPFDNSTEDMRAQDLPILPRHCFIFIGIKDGDVQYKPYEYNPNRIVVATWKGMIVNIESIG